MKTQLTALFVAMSLAVPVIASASSFDDTAKKYPLLAKLGARKGVMTIVDPLLSCEDLEIQALVMLASDQITEQEAYRVLTNSGCR